MDNFKEQLNKTIIEVKELNKYVDELSHFDVMMVLPDGRAVGIINGVPDFELEKLTMKKEELEEFKSVEFCYCKHEMLRAEMEHEITEAVQSNPWVKIMGADFQDDPFMELDYEYNYTWVSCIGELKGLFEHGNWAIRCAFVLGDLCFMQQVNGGDEWLTLKFFKEQGWVSFESISFEPVIRDNEFEDMLARLLTASYEDCKGLNY